MSYIQLYWQLLEEELYRWAHSRHRSHVNIFYTCRCQSPLFKLLSLASGEEAAGVVRPAHASSSANQFMIWGVSAAQPRRLRLGNGRPSGNGLSIPQKMLISLGGRAFATRLLTPTLNKRWHKSKAKAKTYLTSSSPVFVSRSPSNT